MRKLQSNIGSFGKIHVGQGNLLIARFEALRSLCTSSFRALPIYASITSDALWQGLRLSWSKPRVVTVGCLTTVKQRQRRHSHMCHRTVA